jgi:glycosyltransferase involved in cell wall biosynthesis
LVSDSILDNPSPYFTHPTISPIAIPHDSLDVSRPHPPVSDTALTSPHTDQWDRTDYELSDVQMFCGTSRAHMMETLEKAKVDSETTIFVTHGAWSFCSRWGYWLKKLGYKWMAIPQGMLEPWSLRQKWLRKRVYRACCEDRFLRSADFIRAVSTPELANLTRLFGKQNSRIRLIPNGVEVPPPPVDLKLLDSSEKVFLFLGRLHKKKAVAELVQAFCLLPESIVGNSRLLIVGPDQGEQAKIEHFIAKSGKNNIELVGPAFGGEKERYLRLSHFFILPSHSEGFPTSVIEAMAFGCVPLLSPGCNFPEATANDLAISVLPNVDAIRKGLGVAFGMSESEIQTTRQSGFRFIADNYSTDAIAKLQYQAFESLLNQLE